MAWVLLWPVAGGVAILTALIQTALNGKNTAGLVVATFSAGCCSVGCVDATVRYTLAWRANQLFQQAGRTFDPRIRRLMRLATVNNRIAILQLAAGATWACSQLGLL